MIIDTRKRVISIQLRRMVTLMLFAVFIISVILLGKLPKTFLGLNKYHWGIVIFIIYIISMLAESLFQLKYIYFNDENDTIILRYFSLGYVNRVKRSIEIPKSEILSYQVYEYLFGYKKTLVLHQIRNQKEAKYPAVSLSILKKNELSQMLKALDSYKKY